MKYLLELYQNRMVELFYTAKEYSLWLEKNIGTNKYRNPKLIID